MHTIDLKKLREALAKGAVAGFYDNRSRVSYDKLHIKGSTSLPVPEAQAGKGLPTDKAAMLVFY
ncbi:hypothetical protein EDM80_09360 [bacterium]|nr:MAG: hypothetical protein EDM80_09360 [bacterium]RIK63067.1 MAG: hypothetical protein DCC64_08350 [Planctomycetota bacterium]